MLFVSWLHAVVAIALAAYGANALVLTLIFWRQRRRSRPQPPSPSAWPAVTVQLPIYNELHVVERLIEAVGQLDYPRDRLQVQVLDDSTDETQALVRASVEAQRAAGLDIQVIHRSGRSGYKAGALAAALPAATGEFIAIFDADFVPPTGFLRLTVPHLMAAPQAGFVQTRWAHLNADYSWLTRAQALALDGHFAVEQTVRQGNGCFFGFNGSGGVWRRACITQAGGWQADTLCEDLDLSYRAQLQGWQGLYLAEVSAPAEIPPQLAAFKRQQARWATGSIQTLRKLGWQVGCAERPFLVRAEGLLHLSAYLSHPLMLLLLFLTLPLLWLGNGMENPLRWLLAYLGLASAGPPLLFAVAQHRLYPRRWLGRMAALPILMLLGTGIALENTLAVGRGLRGQPGAFLRTPKFHVESNLDQWRDRPYALPLSGIVLAELLLAGYALLTVAAAVARGHLYAVPFLLLFVGGFGLVGLLGLAQGWQRHPGRGRRSQRVDPRWQMADSK